MNTTPDDQTELRAFLRGARPEPALPPGFQNAVWRRIDQFARERRGEGSRLNRFEIVLGWLLNPVRACVAAVALLVVGVSIGIVQGNQAAHELARARYIASVSPIVAR